MTSCVYGDKCNYKLTRPSIVSSGRNVFYYGTATAIRHMIIHIMLMKPDHYITFDTYIIMLDLQYMYATLYVDKQQQRVLPQ